MSTSTEDPTKETKTEQREESTQNGSGDTAVPGDGLDNSKYSGITNLRNFLRPRRWELGMFVTRFFCVYFAIFSMIPIFGDANFFLRRALIANAMTSAIRLYQRVGIPSSLTREFIAYVFIEDSCHYLFYSLYFLYFGHISFSAGPVLLFTSLHVANFALQMLEAFKGAPCKESGFGSLLWSVVTRTQSLLRIVATAEVALIIIILLNSFSGNVSILAPFVYYRFLYLRYASRRNQYTRVVFHEMRIATEEIIARGCPTLIARILRTFIAVLCRLAPPITTR